MSRSVKEPYIARKEYKEIKRNFDKKFWYQMPPLAHDEREWTNLRSKEVVALDWLVGGPRDHKPLEHLIEAHRATLRIECDKVFDTM